MEIFKVGDEISILGYKSITLSDDMQKNVSKFAQLNGVELTEAEKILNSIPGIKAFAETIYSDDVDEDIVITDFTLDDNDFDIKKLNATEKTSAAQTNSNTPTTSSAPIINANSSSNNSNDVKDLLGIFGFPSTTQIDRELENGFILNNKTYMVVLDKNGVIIETNITDANGNVTKGVYPADPRIEMVTELEKRKNALYDLIEPLIRVTTIVFDDGVKAKLRGAIDKCVKDYQNGLDISNMPNHLKLLIAQVDFDVSKLSKEFTNQSPLCKAIKSSINTVCDMANQIVEYDKEQAKYKIETVNVCGVNFRIKYLKNGGNSCTITRGSSDDEIIINGKNCTVDALGYGDNANKNIIINGENVTYNGNATTVKNITNNSKNSTLNGSFGDDHITNNPNGAGTKINAGDGDDEITNYGSKVIINGDDGNDTIVNYGTSTTINGGEGDDALNYVDDYTTVQPSNGNDIINKIELRGTPSDEDPDYPWCKEFTVNGITFKAYSKEDNFETISTSFYKNLLTINASEMKIVVTKANDSSAIKLEGTNVIFNSNVTLKSVFNYANNSNITGTSGNDFLYNYANNSRLNGGAGDDALINEGNNSKLDGGNGVDRIYNRDGSNTTIVNDSKDKIFTLVSPNYEAQQITKGDKSDKDYNMEVTMAYISAELNKTPVPSAPDATSSVISNARILTSKLITTTSNGTKVFSDIAEELIAAAKKENAALTNKIDLLEIALKSIDEDNNGSITEAELNKFKDSQSEEPAEPTSNPSEEQIQAELNSLKSTMKSSIGLTTTEMDNFISSCGSNAAALTKLKQIQKIIDIGVNSSANKTYSMDNIKEMMTSSISHFNNEILADAQILVDADTAPEGKNAYIKSKMITDGSNITLSEMASKTTSGEVVEKNGRLYVNDSGKMVALNISANTYLELFPPVERFFVEQNGCNDCYFIATTLIESMENPNAKAKLLQMFKENSSGDITVTFPGISSYPVTFQNGNLKNTDNQWVQGNTVYSYAKNGGVQAGTVNKKTLTPTQGSLGIRMLEQAYALAKFAEISNSTLTNSQITSTYNSAVTNAVNADNPVNNTNNLDIDKALLVYLEGGYSTEVCDDLFGTVTNGSDEYKRFANLSASQQAQLMSSIYANTLHSNSIVTTLISGGVEISNSDYQKYNIIAGHQYAIEKINPSQKTVTIKNPWDSYKTTDIPYDVFFRYFYGILARTIK